MDRYCNKYPEKIRASSSVHKLKRELDHLHHWSYNEEHYKDVIHITESDHNRLHRFMIYDQERKKYRISSSMELLDTREKHIEFLEWTKTQPF